VIEKVLEPQVATSTKSSYWLKGASIKQQFELSISKVIATQYNYKILKIASSKGQRYSNPQNC